MQALDTRKEIILSAVIEDYIRNVEPVGSQRIIEDHGLGVSSATVRNELAFLEKTGYLFQPHTSAGRVPTDKGYRYYVDKLFKKRNNHIFFDEEFAFQTFSATDNELEVLMHEASNLLSRLTNCVAFVFAPNIKKSYLKHLDLVLIRPQTVLMVLITNTGCVFKKVMDFNYEVSRVSLHNLEIVLNDKLTNLEFKKILEISQNLIEFSPEIRDVAGRVMAQILNCIAGKEHERIFLGGASNILLQPEFRNSKKVQIILETLEQGDIIANLFDEILKPGAISVKIGHENTKAEIHECSFIFGSYGTGEQNLGALGILGPTRLDYLRVISIVGGTAKTLSHFVECLYE